jgi:hypothetical protein
MNTQTIVNDARRAGQEASKGTLHGDYNRYKVVAIHTRFDAVTWFVLDALRVDEQGLPAVVGQCDTKESAVSLTN